VAIAAVSAIGCRSASGGSPGAVAAEVAAVTTVATAVGAINMANHVCFTVCPPGTSCDERTGLCERGHHDDSACGSSGCPAGKSCDSRGLLPQCVEASSGHDEAPKVGDLYRPAHYPWFWFVTPPSLEPLPPSP
jgi:hypothetical protein